jgi:hypothetical protein
MASFCFFKYLGELFHDLTVTVGEVKNLGDIKLVPAKRELAR